jgi:hypothetical protein
MKVKYNEWRAFDRGMNEGVHRLFKEPPAMQAIRYGFSTKRDVNAFVAGYNLTNTSDVYFYAWKGSKNLLNLAITMKDVILVGCRYEWSFYQYTMEEI